MALRFPRYPGSQLSWSSSERKCNGIRKHRIGKSPVPDTGHERENPSKRRYNGSSEPLRFVLSANEDTNGLYQPVHLLLGVIGSVHTESGQGERAHATDLSVLWLWDA